MSYRDEVERLDNKYSSSVHYILSGLIPYTEANLKLSFKPSLFFDDLESLDKVKASKKTLKSAYYRSIKQKLVEIDAKGNPMLTEKGRRKIKLYQPQKLNKSKLMIIFDIPEDERHKRRRLRTLLKELYFRQIQKSVWESQYDSREYLRSEIADMRLQEYVKVYETAQIEV